LLYFDATDAGNFGTVMDALRADSGEAIVRWTPASRKTAAQSIRAIC